MRLFRSLSLKARKRLVMPRDSATMPTYTTSRTTLRWNAPATQKASTISRMPMISWSHQRSKICLGDECDREVEDALHQEEEADQGRERRKRRVWTEDRPDPGADEQDGDDRVHDLPASGRDGHLAELVRSREDRGHSEQDRDRIDRGVVPLEQEQGEHEPRDAGQQKDPPVPGCVCDEVAFVEHRVQRAHRCPLATWSSLPSAGLRRAAT